MEQITYSTDDIIGMLKANVASLTVINDKDIVADITRLLNRWYEKKKRPLYTYDMLSGKKCAMGIKKLFYSRVKKFGSIEKVMTSYLGRASKPKKEANRVLDPDDPAAYRRFKTRMPDGRVDWSWRHPDQTAKLFGQNAPAPELSNDEKVSWAAELTKDTCHRTDLVVKNRCFDCHYGYVCQVYNRKYETDSGRIVRKPNKTMLKHMQRNPDKYHVPLNEQLEK